MQYFYFCVMCVCALLALSHIACFLLTSRGPQLWGCNYVLFFFFERILRDFVSMEDKKCHAMIIHQYHVLACVCCPLQFKYRCQKNPNS